jgi:penicillin-binding protein-related factor A (putative recombinase)
MRGKEFEKEIKELSASYEARRILVLRKCDPPVRMLGKRVLFLKNPFLDFVGAICRNGRALFIEAKETKTGKLPVDNAGGVTEHQMHCLKVWHHAGAVAAVVWRCTDAKYQDALFLPEPRTYFLPVEWIERCLTMRQRKHIKEGDVPARYQAGLKDQDWIKIMLEQNK